MHSNVVYEYSIKHGSKLEMSKTFIVIIDISRLTDQKNMFKK